MSAAPQPRPGDQARASVRVAVPQAEAWRLFTEEIDQWWRRGPRYRGSGLSRGILHLEPRLGGRLFESFDDARGRPRVVQTGEVIGWDPPQRLVLRWRNVNFAAHESTEVEVQLTSASAGTATLVTVTHRGLATLRPDHPARHGLEVAAFVRMMGMWWGELLTALRVHADSGQA